MKFTRTLSVILPFAFSVTAVQLSSYIGCFSTPGSFENLGTNIFQSIGHCINQCTEARYNTGDYAAVKEDGCYCGDVDPAKGDLVDDDQCTEQCPGYAADICGGSKAWSIYAIGEVKSDLWSNETSSSTTSASKEVTTIASSVASTSTGTSISTLPVEEKSTSETPSASVLPPASVASTSPSASASASTSIEPTATGNSASRRYSFLF